MVNSNGYTLNPAITIPNGAQGLTISDDGQVTITMPGQKTPQVLGQIQLAQFINPAGLNSLGGNLFTETAASGAPTVSNPGSDGAGKFASNFLEMSNVQVVEEMKSLKPNVMDVKTKKGIANKPPYGWF